MGIRVDDRRTIQSIRKAGKLLDAAGKTWDEISEELKIYKKDGRINPGLAWRIVMQNYEPTRPETRARLKLDPLCPICHRRLGVRRKKDLFSRSEKELRQMLEMRADPLYETEKSATS